LARVLQVSGSDAVDCGYGEVGNDLAGPLACLETQLASARPFRVVVEVYGLESVLVLAIVRSTSGELKYLDYDPDACNRNCWFEHPQMSEGECPAPQVIREPDGTFARFPIMCKRPDAQ
jgi:hypothetical protein